MDYDNPGLGLSHRKGKPNQNSPHNFYSRVTFDLGKMCHIHIGCELLLNSSSKAPCHRCVETCTDCVGHSSYVGDLLVKKGFSGAWIRKGR